MFTSCGLGPCVFVFTVVPVCSAGAFSETNHMKRDGTLTCVVGQQIGINLYKYVAKELAHGGSLFGSDRSNRESREREEGFSERAKESLLVTPLERCKDSCLEHRRQTKRKCICVKTREMCSVSVAVFKRLSKDSAPSDSESETTSHLVSSSDSTCT